MKNSAYQEIMNITIQLISCGFAIDYNYPVIKDGVVTWADQEPISSTLRKKTYSRVVDEIDIAKNYNFKLIDGSLVQIMYRFSHNGRVLQEHRLAYFPTLTQNSESNELEEQEFFGGHKYNEIVDQYALAIPIRFDYNIDDQIHAEIEHPKCHMHLGQYECCRIPVHAPIAPKVFIEFILRNFYFKAYQFINFGKSLAAFEQCITESESKMIHINHL